jgi:hypothetical protein
MRSMLDFSDPIPRILPSTVADPPPTAQFPDGHSEHKLERIIRSRKRRGRLEYLITLATATMKMNGFQLRTCATALTSWPNFITPRTARSQRGRNDRYKGYSSLYYQVPCLYSFIYRCASSLCLSFRRFYFFPLGSPSRPAAPWFPLSSCCHLVRPLVPPLVLLPSRSPTRPVALSFPHSSCCPLVPPLVLLPSRSPSRPVSL